GVAGIAVARLVLVAREDLVDGLAAPDVLAERVVARGGAIALGEHLPARAVVVLLAAARRLADPPPERLVDGAQNRDPAHLHLPQPVPRVVRERSTRWRRARDGRRVPVLVVARIPARDHRIRVNVRDLVRAVVRPAERAPSKADLRPVPEEVEIPLD